MSVIRQLLSQKKFIAMLAAMGSFGATYAGLDWSLDAVSLFIAPIVAYILAQGAADVGKEAKKIEKT